MTSHLFADVPTSAASGAVNTPPPAESDGHARPDATTPDATPHRSTT